LSLDIETWGVEHRFTMEPERFVRLIGYRWKGDEDVRITTDLEEVREAIRSARWVVTHNGINFDLPAIFGHKSNEVLKLADEGRLLDTFVLAPLVFPAPYEYVNRFGKRALADGPEKMRKWFKLDELAYQLGTSRKTLDLGDLAKEFGGFECIPVDDPRFVEYLKGDVLATEEVAQKLLAIEGLTPYHLREHRIAARAAVISSNGFRVDRKKAQARVDELAARREVILGDLQERYGLPTEGDAPWSTQAGKEAILDALADYGITPETVEWPKTPAWGNREKKVQESYDKASALREKVRTWRDQLHAGGLWQDGKFNTLTASSKAARHRWIARDEDKASELEANPLPRGLGLAFGGSELIELTKGTGAEELGQALAELKGQRSLAQLALDSCYSDGFVHPDITMLQRSGRWSTTNPGLTVWTSRGGGALEKSYFVPDNDDHVLLEVDYSNADARVVAWLSGDEAYAERFEPGADGHLINAWAAWGKDVVGTDKHDPTTAKYRQMAKPLGHGWSYGGGPKTLSKQAGVPFEDAKTFCDGMAAQFHRLVAWQDKVRQEAKKGYVVNPWGRKMFIEEGREFTQAPALYGQSGTREIVCDALLAMPYSVLRLVKASIHDALLFSVPKDRWESARGYLMDLMSTSIKALPGGIDMEFPVDAGDAGDTWMSAAH